jgi:S1-C subfamily serine protease
MSGLLRYPRMAVVVLAVVLGVLVVGPVANAYSPRWDMDELENIAVYDTATKAVVTINALAYGSPASGAGVIVDPAGLILTSSHIVGNSTTVMVSLWNNTQVRGTVIGRVGFSPDANTLPTATGRAADTPSDMAAGTATLDLALLKINTATPLPAISLGDSDQIRVGQKVLAIGHPYGFERTLTTGIISRIDLERQRIQTDAAINPGNSGGPLLDTRGYLLGINQSIFNPDGNRSNIGIGFAVPVNAIKSFLQQLPHQPDLPATIAATSRLPVIRYQNPFWAQGAHNVALFSRDLSSAEAPTPVRLSTASHTDAE